MQKITYASLANLGEDFHQRFDASLQRVGEKRDEVYPFYISGRPLTKREKFVDTSPADTRNILATFSTGAPEDVNKAIVAAREAFPEWRDLGWRRRVALLRKAAELMTERQFDLAAILTLEVGKNRFEAIAEVSESIDLILYYAQQIEHHDGYEIPLVTAGTEQTRSVLKPYGVWAVVSPFNFPLALAAGMATGALLAGNTVVFKPATDTPWSGLCLYEILQDAALPPGVFNVVTGSGRVVGETLLQHLGLDGFIFTGSRAVGVAIQNYFTHRTFPRPCITELGGKNPAIVMPSANLDDATEGVLRSAFGMGGQKCSACSRLYLHEKLYQPFLDLLIEKTRNIRIGDPAERDTFLGPLINKAAVDKYAAAVRLGRKDGRLLHGGATIRNSNFAHGFFVEPTIVDRLPKGSRMFREEFFAPILSVAKVKSLKEAIQLSNAVEYGLTAGIFTQDEAEQKQFFDEIEAGVTYSNRRGGATTGAWPGVQSFGGWKASGSSGKSALGPHYVAQFMREQSQTIVKK